ncbi:MAG TPA: MarR family transcriptional regulator [Propionibacteriaceae bacterium]
MTVEPPSAEAISDQLDLVTRRQQEFERRLANSLRVDSAGLATMDHLMRSGQATPTELARQVQISTAAMTLVLDRLEAAGHVSREPHASDRRKVVITAADGSVRSARNLVEPLIDRVEALISAMQPGERTVVSTFLAGVLGAYDSVLAEGTGPPQADPVRPRPDPC